MDAAPHTASCKRTHGPNWTPIALYVVKAAMGGDWAFYAALAAPRPAAAAR